MDKGKIHFQMTTKSRSRGFVFLVMSGLLLYVGPKALAIPTSNDGNGGHQRNRALFATANLNGKGGHQGKHHGGRSTTVVPPTAPDVFTTLGSAGPSHWTVLEVGNGTVTEQGAIYGNVGIQQKGKLQDSGPTINGNLYLGNKSSAAFTSSSTVTGTVHRANAAIVSPNTLTTVNDSMTQTTLSQARSQAMAASSMASSVASTSSLTNVNLGNTTMSLTSGVYNLSSLNLDHSTLTLSGSGYFVFNISSNFVFNSGKVLLAGGASESNILFNYTGTSQVTLGGGTGSDESVLHGILLALNAKVNLSPGLVVGEIISGQDIALMSGSVVQQDGAVAAVPDRASTLELSIIALGGIAAFRSLTLRSRARRIRST
jgi:hypothetical protein